MLKHTSQNRRRINPLDFDMAAIGRASNLLLGKKKTDELMKNLTPKKRLALIGTLEAEAAEVVRDPNRAMPADAPKNATPETREAAVSEIQQWKQLHLSGSQEMQLPYRLRGTNQLNAILHNDISVNKGENSTTAAVTVSLAALKRAVTETEQNGRCTVVIDTSPADAEYYRTALADAKVSLQFQDELSERPETKRAWLGNVARRCVENARINGTLPQDELAKIAEEFSGTRVNLAKGGEIAGVSVEKTPAGTARLSVEIKFPELEEKITAWAMNSNGKEHPGKGFITDGILSLHTAHNHGCNGRDFVNVSPDLSKTLTDNAVKAARKWLGKDGGPELLEEFARDYSAVALTMRPRMTPPNRLEPAKSRLARPEDILPLTESPEEIYATETIDGIERAGFSCPASAGGDWVRKLRNKQLEVWEEEEAIQYEGALEKRFGMEKPREKAMAIHRNFLGLESLDGGPQEIQIKAPFLTDEIDEEFETAKERHDQDTFDSKTEGDILDKAEWLDDHGNLEVKLDATGPILHRLKRYQKNPKMPTRTGKNRAEALDADIRMPNTPNGRWTKPAIRLKDFLTEKGREELETTLNGSNERARRTIEAVESTIERWQNGLQKLDPMAKNPLEGILLEWAESIAEGKDAEKGSLDEVLSILSSPSIRNAGRIPFGEDRTPRYMDLPIRSNPLPLQLLCGDGSKANTNLKDRTEELWDMVTRLQCAAQIQEEKLPERDENRIKELEATVAAFDDDQLIAHAVAMECAEKPDTLKAYLTKIGIPNGVFSLPEELRDMADLVMPKRKGMNLTVSTASNKVFRNPETGNFKGEETYLADLMERLAEQDVQIGLSDEEKAAIAKTPAAALQQWGQTLVESSRKLAAIEAPTGQNTRISLMLSAQELGDSEEAGFFPETMEVLHKEIPQSKTDVEDIATALLTHSPKELVVTAGNDEHIIRKGTGNRWIGKAGVGEQIAEKVNLVEDMLAGKEGVEKSEHDDAAITRAAGKAYGARILANAEKIGEMVATLPPLLGRRNKMRELTEPLTLLSTQLAQAKQAQVRGAQVLTDWKQSDTSNVWGWENFEAASENHIMKFVEMTAERIIGKDATPDEKRHDYLAQHLIREADKKTLVEALKNGGKQAAAFHLQTILENNMKFIEATAAEMLPELVTNLQTQINGLIETARAPETLAKIEQSPIGTYLRDNATGRALEQKIRDEAKRLSIPENPTTNIVDGKRVVTYDRDAKDVLIGINSAVPVKIVADAEKNQITTNKTWVSGWLKTNQGAENLQRRINTLNWIRDMANTKAAKLEGETEEKSFTPKLAVAFLAFCSRRPGIMQGVSEAVSGGALGDKEKKVLETGLNRFRGALDELGIDPAKAKLRTLLIAGEALNQYCAAQYAKNRPWEPAWDKDLENLSGPDKIQVGKPVLAFAEQIDKPMAAVGSPFQTRESEQDLESTREKVAGVKRAAGMFRETGSSKKQSVSL